MTGSRAQQPLLRQVAQIVLLAALLAGAYNWFSLKSMPLIRKESVKVAVSDSDLFRGGDVAARDSALVRANGSPDSTHAGRNESGVKVIAPLHERALANPDSAARAAASSAKEEKQIYRIITLSQLNRLLARGHNMLIDARDTAAYRKGHIKGARNMFGMATDQYFPELAMLPRDTLVLIYCNNPDCHLGRMLAEFMGAIGYTNMYLYDDGWDGWEKAKMPVDSSMEAEAPRP